jgi:hypothetical protein
MTFRKLRIAWSVVCGIACVLLIVLWVRSARDTLDLFEWQYDASIHIASLHGRMEVFINMGKTKSPYTPRGFNYTSRQDKFDWFQHTGFAEYGFEFVRGGVPGAYFLILPHWLLAAFAGFLLAAAWIRWHFTLRTLLIATTLVAIVLGLIVWAAQ